MKKIERLEKLLDRLEELSFKNSYDSRILGLDFEVDDEYAERAKEQEDIREEIIALFNQSQKQPEGYVRKESKTFTEKSLCKEGGENFNTKPEKQPVEREIEVWKRDGQLDNQWGDVNADFLHIDWGEGVARIFNRPTEKQPEEDYKCGTLEVLKNPKLRKELSQTREWDDGGGNHYIEKVYSSGFARTIILNGLEGQEEEIILEPHKREEILPEPAMRETIKPSKDDVGVVLADGDPLE